MFGFIQRHNKIFQVLLFLLIVPSFVVVGLEGYNGMRDTGPTVGTVAGTPITSTEFDAANKAEIERVRAENPNIDIKLLDSESFRQSTMDRLVRQKVQALAAKDSRLLVSDAALAKVLRSDPSIAALVGPDGKLDSERYKALVASVGLTPAQHEARVRADMSTRQVFGPLVASGLVAKSVGDLTTQAFLQKREVHVLQFKVADYMAQVKTTDADVEAYYKAHPASFQVPEQANIEYVVLDQASIQKSLVVTDKQLQEYFDNNNDKLLGPEQRRASHILIAAGMSSSASEREKAKARATALQAEVVKAPDTFAQVAKANSQDPGSAEKGGDLNFFSRGEMTKPFEDAAFALNVGEISKVIESDFGYHVIKLVEIKKPKSKTFEELKPQLDAAVRQQLAQQKYAEVAEQFSNAVYEQGDALKEVAVKLKLDLQTANGLGRAPAPGAKGALADPKFLGALFSAESINKKTNTEAIEIGPSQLVSGHIVSYTPAKTAAFADVKARAQTLLVQSLAQELAKKEGTAKLASIKASANGAGLPPAFVLSRDKPAEQAAKVLDAALSADPTKLPSTVGVDLGPQGYAIVRVNKIVQDAVIEPQLQQQFAAQSAQAFSASETQAYLEVLKAKYKVQVKSVAAPDAEKK
jgi:peptidyl-prolyl cis-trans isomerase D